MSSKECEIHLPEKVHCEACGTHVATYVVHIHRRKQYLQVEIQPIVVPLALCQCCWDRLITTFRIFPLPYIAVGAVYNEDVEKEIEMMRKQGYWKREG